MPFLPYSYLTDREFLQHLLRKDNPSDEEVEAVMRIERLMGQVESLEEELADYSRIVERA